MDDLERQRKQGFKEYEMKKKAEQDHRMVCLCLLIAITMCCASRRSKFVERSLC